MDNIKSITVGAIITIVIGGTAYTISQEDIVQNFAEDTGYTQEQAEQYIGDLSEEDFADWDEIGNDYMNESRETLSIASEIDCVNYEYEWESATLSCSEGKIQLETIGRDEETLGRSYIRLASESASEDDMARTITRIDQLNFDYQFEIVTRMFDPAIMDEIKRTNSYNKALLQAALDSD